MKVTLDLSRLLAEGTITRVEHDRLALLGRQDTAIVVVNLLVGFGVIAVVLGIVALVPSALVSVVIGGTLMVIGLILTLSGPPRWAVLSTICILIAALLLGGGLILLSQGVATFDNAHAVMPLWLALVLVAGLYGVCAVLARSGLIASLAVLMLFAALGGMTSYDSASYWLQVTEPFATVVLFSALALAAYRLSRRLAPQWERLAIIVARVALFVSIRRWPPCWAMIERA
jgi:iron complex transport system permease protein